ncbi:terpenoid synthase [Collybia nuda]|uniref:(2E,6E)-farnesyl diphosphate synthase n=1 Tax=Collybia nuda TaxID=64659 RepID=A0A9P5XTM9_9AGAR|nr:terpenoid synthase [Collybia nuda]
MDCSNLLNVLSTELDWSSDDDAVLLEPYTYLTCNPGKEFRTSMILAFNKWLNVPEPELKIIISIVKKLHNASLLIDDIEDNSMLRRGRPVAHKLFGIPQTLNTGNYVYFLAFQELRILERLYNSKASTVEYTFSPTNLDQVLIAELLSLHRGQGLDLLWRDSLQCPTEAQYISMVNQKTGGLLRIGIRLMMSCRTTNIDEDYVPLVNSIGVLFQIRDDYMNLKSDNYAHNKGFAEDLTEGKFSFPVVHGVRADMGNRQLLNILQKRPTTPTLKKHAISYLQDHTKSFDYTAKVIHQLDAVVRAEVKRLGGNPDLEALLNTMLGI